MFRGFQRLLLLFFLPSLAYGQSGNSFTQSNLVSDGSVQTRITDRQLINPWGIAGVLAIIRDVFVFLFLTLSLAGCSGSNGNPIGPNPVPIGMSTVTVTATSGSLSHTGAFTLTVQ